MNTINKGAGTQYSYILPKEVGDYKGNALMSPRFYKKYLELRVKNGDRLAKKAWKIWKDIYFWN